MRRVVGASRPAALALLLLAIVALVVVLAIDLPDLDETGLYGRDYEQAVASAGLGLLPRDRGSGAAAHRGGGDLVFGPRRERDADARIPREPDPAGVVAA